MGQGEQHAAVCIAKRNEPALQLGRGLPGAILVRPSTQEQIGSISRANTVTWDQFEAHLQLHLRFLVCVCRLAPVRLLQPFHFRQQ